MLQKKYLLLVLLCIAFFSFESVGYGAKDNDEGNVLATVNGESITIKDFRQSTMHRPPMPPEMMRDKQNQKFRQDPRHLKNKENHTFREDPRHLKRYLHKAVEQKLLLQESLKLDLDKDPFIVKRVEELQQRLLIDALYRRITANELKDEKLEKYYRENKAKYSKERVKASHILVKTEAEARDILKQLNESASFETLAQKHSLDPSGKRGGDLGFISRGKMAPKFDDALFAIKKIGDISPIVKTRFGYHIIKLTAELQKNTEPFNRVKNMIRRNLKKELIQDYIGKLKKKAKISITEKYK